MPRPCTIPAGWRHGVNSRDLVESDETTARIDGGGPSGVGRPEPRPIASPRRAQRADRQEKTGVSAILVDVVVRDKKGDPVRGLTEADFENLRGRREAGTGLLHAGVPGPGAARRGTGAPTAAAASAPAATAPAASAIPEVIALVFDRLTPDARSLATKAALGYVGPGPGRQQRRRRVRHRPVADRLRRVHPGRRDLAQGDR